jgi:hypothetical protein
MNRRGWLAFFGSIIGWLAFIPKDLRAQGNTTKSLIANPVRNFIQGHCPVCGTLGQDPFILEREPLSENHAGRYEKLCVCKVCRCVFSREA